MRCGCRFPRRENRSLKSSASLVSLPLDTCPLGLRIYFEDTARFAL